MRHLIEIRATRSVWATALFTALAMIQLPGCGGGGGGGDSAPAANPVVSATIGPEGGSLTSGDSKMTLEVPAGALATETEITIRPLGSVPQALSDLAPVVGPAYELEPDGAIFNQPVSISLELNDLDLAGLQPAGGTLVYSLLTLDANGAPEVLARGEMQASLTTGVVTVRGETSHFSPLAVGMIFDALELELTGIADKYLIGTEFESILTAVNFSDTVTYYSAEATQFAIGSVNIVLPPIFNLFLSLGPQDAVTKTPPYLCETEGRGTARVGIEFWVHHPALLNQSSPYVIVGKDTECIDPSGTHDVSVTVVDDPAGHDPFIHIGGLKHLDVGINAAAGSRELTVTGFGPWINVSGPLANDGSFIAMGRGIVGTFPTLSVKLEGTLTVDGLSALYTMGTEGELPQALPIIYGVDLRF